MVAMRLLAGRRRKAGFGGRLHQRSHVGLAGLEPDRRGLALEVDLGVGDAGYLLQRFLDEVLELPPE